MVDGLLPESDFFDFRPSPRHSATVCEIVYLPARAHTAKQQRVKYYSFKVLQAKEVLNPHLGKTYCLDIMYCRGVYYQGCVLPRVYQYALIHDLVLINTSQWPNDAETMKQSLMTFTQKVCNKPSGFHYTQG